jgi:hypothetical protein
MAAMSTRRRPRKARAAAAAMTARAGLARAVRLVTAIVALILIVGIVLVLLRANPSNDLVSAVRDAAAFLAGPFDQMFELDRRRVETAVNWGIAAAVWFILGSLIARVIRR